MIKSFKIRIFPTKKQEQLMRKHIGACRYVYNLMLEKQNERFTNGEKRYSGYDMINLLTFVIYGIDKLLAILHKVRVMERVLFLLAFIGGGLGALLGMLIFRHKTLKIKFYLWNVTCIILWVYVIWRFL